MNAGTDGISSFLSYLKAERRLSAHTVRAYQNDLDQLRVFLFGVDGNEEWNSIDSSDIRSFLIYLRHKRLARTSINRSLSTLRTFFQFMKRQKQMDFDPSQDLKNLKTPKRQPHFLTPTQANQLASLFKLSSDFAGYRDKTMLGCFLYTGMRRAELVGLKTGDVSFAGSSIRVMGKRQKERLIPLHPVLVDWLKDYLIKRADFMLEIGAANATEALFITNQGKPCTGDWMYSQTKKYLSQVTQSDYRGPHLLRHTFATWLLSEGADILAVKELLGHAGLAATQVYTHVSIDRLKMAYAKAHPKGQQG